MNDNDKLIKAKKEVIFQSFMNFYFLIISLLFVLSLMISKIEIEKKYLFVITITFVGIFIISLIGIIINFTTLRKQNKLRNKAIKMFDERNKEILNKSHSATFIATIIIIVFLLYITAISNLLEAFSVLLFLLLLIILIFLFFKLFFKLKI